MCPKVCVKETCMYRKEFGLGAVVCAMYLQHYGVVYEQRTCIHFCLFVGVCGCVCVRRAGGLYVSRQTGRQFNNCTLGSVMDPPRHVWFI